LVHSKLAVFGDSAGVLQQRARRRIGDAVYHLTPPEQAIFRDLRAFVDQPTLPVDSFPARWTLGEERFRRILVSFERDDLLAVDATRDVMEIPVFVALYLPELRDVPDAPTKTAFVLRPFGNRNGIDFDHVQRELIDPTLIKLGIRSTTADSLLEAGSVRADLFQLLLAADVVIADVSLAHGGAFYHPGVRHALPPNHTIVVRSATSDAPLELRSDRGLTYEPHDPGKAIDELLRTARATLASDRTDSPLFLTLPELPPLDPSRLLLVPPA